MKAWNPAERGIELLCSVEDSGRGIHPAETEYIFEAFYQPDQTLDRPDRGIGLDLVISRELVAAMGGRPVVQGRPGRGSIFSFNAPHKMSFSPTLTAPPLAAQAGGPVILAISHRFSRDTLGEVLTCQGLRVLALDSPDRLDNIPAIKTKGCAKQQILMLESSVDESSVMALAGSFRSIYPDGKILAIENVHGGAILPSFDARVFTPLAEKELFAALFKFFPPNRALA